MMKHGCRILVLVLANVAWVAAQTPKASVDPYEGGLPQNVDLRTWSFNPLEGDAMEAAPLGRALYVIQSAANASDENPGTQDKPFKTISRGVQGLKAGDALYIGGGIYREFVDVQARGLVFEEKAREVLIRNLPGETVSIRGSDPVSGWKQTGEGKWEAAWDHFFSLSSTKLDAVGKDLTVVRDMLFVEGKRLRGVDSAAEVADGCFFPDRVGHKLVIGLPAGQDPSKLLVEATAREWGMMVTGVNIRLRGLDVRHVASRDNRGALEVWGDKNTLECCRAEQNACVGLYFKGYKLLARRNIGSDNGMTGMAGSTFSGLFVDNITDGNDWRHFRGFAGGGIKIVGGAPSHNRIVRHIARHNYHNGIWYDFACTYNTIEKCFVYDNVSAGIFIEASPGPNYVISNIISGTTKDPSSVEAKRWWQEEGVGVRIQCSTGVYLYNNTIVNNETSGVVLTTHEVRQNENEMGGQLRLRNLTMQNNLIAFNGLGQVFLWGGAAGEDRIKGHHFDNNLYFPAGHAILLGSETKPLTLVQWQQQFAQDSHGVSADPGLTQGSFGPFSLGHGSPAVGAGAITSALVEAAHRPLRDFFGQPRTGATTDLGAVLYQAREATTQPTAR